MNAALCHRLLREAGVGFALTRNRQLRYTGKPVPEGLAICSGEFLTWMQAPPSYRKMLGDQHPRHRQEVEEAYDRRLRQLLQSDGKCRPRTGADLAMRVAFAASGGRK